MNLGLSKLEYKKKSLFDSLHLKVFDKIFSNITSIINMIGNITALIILLNPSENFIRCMVKLLTVKKKLRFDRFVQTTSAQHSVLGS